MKKTDAIELLGGSVAAAAKAIGINPQAISQWPERLPSRLADRVIAACVRSGIEVPQYFLSFKNPEFAKQESAHD